MQICLNVMLAWVLICDELPPKKAFTAEILSGDCVWPLEFSHPRLHVWHWILQAAIGFRHSIHTSHAKFYMWTMGNCRNNSKTAPISLYFFDKSGIAQLRLHQLYFKLRPSSSVCLSVCLPVTPFWLCSHHRIIMKFSGVITEDQGNVHAKGQGQRSKVKVTEVTTQLNGFQTVTPVWIHIWWWNDTYSLMLLRRGALLFFKVIRQISRSQGAKNRRIWPWLGVSGLLLQFEFTNEYEMLHKAWSSIEEVPYCFPR